VLRGTRHGVGWEITGAQMDRGESAGRWLVCRASNTSALTRVFAASDEQNRFTLFSPPLANGRALGRALVFGGSTLSRQWGRRTSAKRCISDIARRWHHFREGPQADLPSCNHLVGSDRDNATRH